MEIFPTELRKLTSVYFKGFLHAPNDPLSIFLYVVIGCTVLLLIRDIFNLSFGSKNWWIRSRKACFLPLNIFALIVYTLLLVGLFPIIEIDGANGKTIVFPILITYWFTAAVYYGVLLLWVYGGCRFPSWSNGNTPENISESETVPLIGSLEVQNDSNIRSSIGPARSTSYSLPSDNSTDSNTYAAAGKTRHWFNIPNSLKQLYYPVGKYVIMPNRFYSHIAIELFIWKVTFVLNFVQALIPNNTMLFWVLMAVDVGLLWYNSGRYVSENESILTRHRHFGRLMRKSYILLRDWFLLIFVLTQLWCWTSGLWLNLGPDKELPVYFIADVLLKFFAQHLFSKNVIPQLQHLNFDPDKHSNFSPALKFNPRVLLGDYTSSESSDPETQHPSPSNLRGHGGNATGLSGSGGQHIRNTNAAAGSGAEDDEILGDGNTGDQSANNHISQAAQVPDSTGLQNSSPSPGERICTTNSPKAEESTLPIFIGTPPQNALNGAEGGNNGNGENTAEDNKSNYSNNSHISDANASPNSSLFYVAPPFELHSIATPPAH